MITNLKAFKESKLVPRNLNGRAEKLRKQNLKLLQQKTIYGDMTISDDFDFSKEQSKVELIVGDVELLDIDHIPEWMKNVKIDGSLDISNNFITSLANCPQSISEDLDIGNNDLESLEGCPKRVGTSFYCNLNPLTSLKGGPEWVGYNYVCCNCHLESLEGLANHIGEDLHCFGNEKDFTDDDIPNSTQIFGDYVFNYKKKGTYDDN